MSFFSVSLPGKLESLEKCLTTILIQRHMQLYLAKCFFSGKKRQQNNILISHEKHQNLKQRDKLYILMHDKSKK